MTKSYKGYSLFNDVEDAALRTYNRCVVMCNGNHDQGSEFSEGYGAQLNKVDRIQMMAMIQYIKVKGANIVLQELKAGKLSKGA